MKVAIVIIAVFCALLAQVLLLGINGLTLITIPMTIYLGIEVIDKVLITNDKEQII